VKGLENIPQRHNFIVVANHASFLDPVLIGAAIPRKINWIALQSVYNTSWLRFFMGITKVLPTGNSSSQAIHLLTQNEVIGLFPEGTRTHDGSLREFKRGAALLALKTGRPIIPCIIKGAFEVLPRKAAFPRLKPITIVIGEPKILLKEFDDVIDDYRLQEGIFKIRTAMQEMIAHE
jgi:1-acyl-sn-glycerol-3-phosphate acyltransferase